VQLVAVKMSRTGKPGFIVEPCHVDHTMASSAIKRTKRCRIVTLLFRGRAEIKLLPIRQRHFPTGDPVRIVLRMPAGDRNYTEDCRGTPVVLVLVLVC
jgi:hypothetical protein